MKRIFESPLIQLGLELVYMVVLLLISIEVDKFCFGLMNPSHTISFGVGVGMFTLSNLIAAYLVVQICKDMIENLKLLKQKNS